MIPLLAAFFFLGILASSLCIFSSRLSLEMIYQVSLKILLGLWLELTLVALIFFLFLFHCISYFSQKSVEWQCNMASILVSSLIFMGLLLISSIVSCLLYFSGGYILLCLGIILFLPLQRVLVMGVCWILSSVL